MGVVPFPSLSVNSGQSVAGQLPDHILRRAACWPCHLPLTWPQLGLGTCTPS